MVGDLITVDDVARFEGVAKRSILRQLEGQRATTLVARREMGPSGRMRWMVYSGTMSLAAQKRYSAEKMTALAEPQAIQDSKSKIQEASPETAQIPLLPVTEEDKIVNQAILKLNPSQVAPVMARFRAIQPTMNHDFSALGLGRKTPYEEQMAKQLGMGRRHFLRLREKFIEVSKEQGLDAAIQSLALNSPGPKKWTGTPLDLDTDEGQSNAMMLKDIWENDHLTRRQTYQKFVHYLETKQRGTGPSWVYTIPSEPAVCRFINLAPPFGLGGDDNPRRRGPEAIKEAAGYIDREYDEAAGDAWCTDEWEMDVYAADRELPRRVYNWGNKNPILHLISYIDERTTCILDWMLTTKIDADTIVLAERMVRKYWVPKRLVADRAGRFRQLANACRITRESGELIEKITGPLGELGVKPRSGVEHNPRANRIERLQLEYARRARRDFGKSWRPPESSGISREATGIDERVRAHLRRKHQTDPTELIWFDEIPAIVAKWVEEINNAPTEAKGCNGMTRLEAFQYFQPTAEEIERRRPSSQMIDLAFAERAERVIRKGGIVVWADGLRYSTPELDDNRAEILPMLRYRRDLSQIVVHVEDRDVIAPRREVVGCNDEDLLSEAMERQNHTRKLMARTTDEAPTLENAPDSPNSAAGPAGETKALNVEHDASNVSSPDPATAIPPQEEQVSGFGCQVSGEEQDDPVTEEISTTAYFARRRRVSRVPDPESREEGVGFADLE